MFWRKKESARDKRLIAAIIAMDLADTDAALQAGASANARNPVGQPALALAASRRWLEGVQSLLAYGADANAVAHAPGQALKRAPVLILPAANGSATIVKALLQAGARVDSADETRLTALMSAAYMGHSEIVDLLLAHGAHIEAKDERGYTALMFASNAGRAEAVRVLLAAKANPHATDAQSSTALMFAAQHAHDEVVAALLHAGADPTCKGVHGLSAIGFAQQNNHQSTLRLLWRTSQASH